MITDSFKHFTRAASTAALVAIAAGAGLAAHPATAAVPSVRVEDSSFLRCHLELPARVKGHRFITSYDGAVIACAGMLLSRPVVAGALPHARGALRVMHHAQDLPPAIGKTQLTLHAVGPELPLTPPEHTRVELLLSPDPASIGGAGHFTGSARIRRRVHQVAASMVFQRDANTTGRLIVDLSAWAIDPRG